MAKTIGGGNLTQLFSLGTNWAVGASIFTGNEHLVNQFSTALSGHEKTKNLQATLTHERFDSEFTDLLDEYLWTDEPTEEFYEDGSPAGGSVSDPTSQETPVGLAICYSGRSAGKRLVRAFPFRLQGGGYTMENNASIRPETTLVSVKAGATITIQTATLNTNVAVGGVSTPEQLVIGEGKYGVSKWLVATT
jgi:hypothetical protein